MRSAVAYKRCDAAATGCNVSSKKNKVVNWYANHDALVGTVANVNCRRRQRKDKTRRHGKSSVWSGMDGAFAFLF
jgi:hypothetical protein